MKQSRWLGLVAAPVCLLAASATYAQEPPAQPPTAPAPTAPAQTAPPPAGPMAAPAAPNEEDSDHPAANSVYGELLGAAIAYSVNYERLVEDQLGVRVGFEYWSASASTTTAAGTSSSSSTFLAFPVTASYIGLRSGKSSLEVGGGATLAHASASAGTLGVSSSGSGTTGWGVLMLGYRLHPVGHAGFQFRVGAMTLIGKGFGLSNPDPSKFGLLPWGYLSFGGSF